MKRFRSTVLALSFLWGGSVTAQSFSYGMVELPDSGGNPYSLVGPSGTMIWSGIFDALTVMEADGSLQPALATSWQQIDSQTWDFTLREGVTFSDGSAFNADTVAATYAWLRTDVGRLTMVGQELLNIAAVDAVGPNQIRIRLKQPDAILPVRTSLVSVVEPRAWANEGPDAFARKPIGTGSFAVEDWRGGNRELIMKAVPTSWRPPVVDEIVVRVVPQAVSRTQALITGQVDVVESIAFDDVDLLRSNGLEVLASPTSQVMALAFVTVGNDDEPQADVRVRQALNYAVDKETIALALTDGITTPTAQASIKGMSGYNEAVTPYPYDPERAQALLSEAGYPEGFPFEISVVVGGYIPADAAIYQKVAEDLRAVGVDVTMRTILIPAYYENLTSGNWDDIQAFGASYQGRPYGDPLRSLRQNSCLWPSAYFCEPSVVPLLQQAERAETPAERTRVLKELAVRYKEVVPSLFIVAQAEVIGVSPRLTNVRRRNRTLVLHEIGVQE